MIFKGKNKYIYTNTSCGTECKFKLNSWHFPMTTRSKEKLQLKKKPEPWKCSIIIIHNLSLTVLLSNSLFLVGVRSCFPFKSNTLLKNGNVHVKNLTSDFLHTFSILISTQPVTVSVSASAF